MQRNLAVFCLSTLSLLVSGGASAQLPWVGTWATAPIADPYPGGALTEAHTWRQIVHVSRGGSRVRVTFTNELGTDPLLIAGAHLGLRAEQSRVVPGSDRPLTFGGESSITVPPGAVAVSDPVTMTVAPLGDLAITLQVPPQPLHTMTFHSVALQQNYDLPGASQDSAEPPQAKPFDNWRFLKNVEVTTSPGSGAIVALGDSITDGYRSAANANHRWPDVLAARLQTRSDLRGLGVLNEGISAGRVLQDGYGPSALARFDRDVLSQSDVRYLVILEGINDVGRTDQPNKPGDVVTTKQLIIAMEQMIERAHAHGIKAYGATLTPFVGAGYASPAGETMRTELNTWIRTGGRFDAVIDFDKATRDPQHPERLLPAYDCGDHLHPNDAGYKAMGDSIDLSLFTR